MNDEPSPSHDAGADHAGVAFHPPIMLGLLLLLGVGLRVLLPLPFVGAETAALVGPAIVIVAFVVFVWAVGTMIHAGASVPTHEPTAVIVTRGPYRFSRNPIYVAMVLLLLGIGIWANTLWFVAFAVLAAGLLSWGVIAREEAYLARKFGSEYTAYKSRVRRWV